MQLLEDLKSILHSHRANIYYLEYCRVLQKDGRIVYLSETNKELQYWNIPIANTTCLLLGTGTSITQAAMRMLAQAGVLVGFCGSGATPLLMANEIQWLTPQSEYRPTEYVQGWMSFWFDELKRLEVAKRFQTTRIDFISKVYTKDKNLKSFGFDINEIQEQLNQTKQAIQKAPNVRKLLQLEADLTKRLYKYSAQTANYKNFSRDHRGADLANEFLNHGNYLAYGLAASTLWVLGIPHAFAVMHGKTRRGALVFDIADLIKDALVLPWAFICAMENMDEKGFRNQCLQNFVDYKALNFMFEEVKDVALLYSKDSIK